MRERPDIPKSAIGMIVSATDCVVVCPTDVSSKGEETSEHLRTHNYKVVDKNHFKLLGISTFLQKT